MSEPMQMFVGYLMMVGIIFLPLILISIIGMIYCKRQIKAIDKEMETRR